MTDVMPVGSVGSRGDDEFATSSRISGFVKMMDTLKTCSSADAAKSGCLTIAEATELVEHYNRLYQLQIPTSRVNVSGLYSNRGSSNRSVK